MDTDNITKQMRRTYDLYFLNGGYRRRYPRPNTATFDFVLENGALEAARILDFGCGDGRYCTALLRRTKAHVTAYDISASSLMALDARLLDTPHRKRVTLIGGDISQLERDAPYDLVLMLFGVLSLIGDRAARVDVLSKLRRLIRHDGRLVISVPCIWRRRPVELLRFAVARCLGRAKPPLDESGSIRFSRETDGQRLTFFYHLYGLRDLHADLSAAGFAIRRCEPESFLPESWVTRSNWIERMDRRVCTWLPAIWGYGLRVMAVPV